ncbi:class I SAM-dependent methyltransferase [Nitrosopumilus sp.]|uniref:class I SAM-dependent methyltransferase n=1 Tax=Nitrosopumilus sp. TaxID=2024843 RepID=UPI002931522B|nr:class I SAM-dependent methyltransferase [Nitrosopumilus sp.]
MISINPLDVFFWTFRRNEKDVINLYNTLSPVMQLATGGSMLNFGYWSEKNITPLSAQDNLCTFFGNFAELSSARLILDVGSGLSSPSKLWRDSFTHLNICCVNTNFKQLLFSGPQKNIEFLNSTSTKLPIANNLVDRVLALESAQHFKPLSEFIKESKRILKENGLLVLAVPTASENFTLGKLDLLKYTWSSEHYTLNYLKELIESVGFQVCGEKLIGSDVYEPLADYYIENRNEIKKSISKKYPGYVENILFQSIQKMRTASQEKIIEYALIKCRL